MTELLAVEFDWRPLGELTLQAGKLLFPPVSDVPGIYRFDLSPNDAQPTTYIGQTDRLRRRFQHYRTPGPTQHTNIRLNKLVVDLLSADGTAAVWTCTSASVGGADGRQPLDLAQKACRILLEHAALVLALLDGRKVENL